MLTKGGLFPEDHVDFLDSVGLKALVSFFTVKASRRGLRLLPYVAIGVVALLTLIHLASNRLSDHGYGSGSRILSWRPGAGYEHKSGDGGLRIVVFGGGDVATLGKAAGKGSSQNSSWTEVLCKELGCSSHLSYLPQIGDNGGSLISNSLYDTALNRTIFHPDYDLGNGEGYRWLLDHHPVPAELPDLQQQINAFLASPRPNTPFKETLWVFNFGFWDIWKLSSMPRKLAHEMMEQQVNYLFSQIEMLCQKARSPRSVAFSDSNSGVEADDTESQIEPFRIMIPRVFDVSLTPGFATARFHPPMPYSRAEEMRNAAWLTEQWDKMIDASIGDWIAFHPPIRPGAAEVEADASGAGKKAAPLRLARREAINVDAPKYLRWVIVDRQLRNLQVQDSKGLGTLPTEVGFENVQDPCVSPWSPKNGSSAPKRPTGLGPNTSVCETPQEHLFWNEFTVNSRAITAIGKLARIRYEKHMAKGDPWLKKAQDRMPDLTTRNVEQQFKG